MSGKLVETILVDKAVNPGDAPLASAVMTAALQHAEADWSLKQLAAFFAKHKISGAPVKDDTGEWIGVVTVTDLARHEQYTQPRESLEEVHQLYDEFIGQQYMPEDEKTLANLAHSSHKVKSIMTPKVFTVHAEAKATDIAKSMVKKRVHRVLVTDGNGLVGIISSLDLLGFFSARC